MSNPLRCLVVAVLLSASACAPGGVESEIQANCGVFCGGFTGCLRGAGCTFDTSEAATRARCMQECSRIAMTMTAAQLDETLVCLRCMDGELDPGTCTQPTLMNATMRCMAPCAADGPSYYLGQFSVAVTGVPMPGYTCAMP